MTGVIATIPRFQFSNALGVPLAAGKLYTYLAGTTTPATTYQDQTLTIANENPVQLDARGECVLWLDPAKSYKFVLKSAIGVTQWTQDNVVGALASNQERPVQTEIQVAAEGQQVFTLQKIKYTPGIGSLHVYLNGLRLSAADYTETSGTAVTFTRGLSVNDEVLFEAGSGVNSQSYADASMIPIVRASGGASNVQDVIGGFDAFVTGDNAPMPARRGFWANDASGVNIHRLRDRVFIGDGVKHTGRSAAPYGGTWLGEKIGTWPEKSAQALILSSEEKIALLAGAQATAAGGASVIGIAAFSHNERPGGTARALYADATHRTGAAASYAMEIATNNTGADVQVNSYSLPGGVIGLHATPEGGSGYTLGDADTAAPVATAPSTVMLNIGAGSGGTANKRWNLGIRFGSNALTTDGSGNSVAMSMSQGQTLEWMASSTVYGARIRSKVTATAGQDVGLQFDNNLISMRSTGMVATIADFAPVANGVNNVRFTNAAAGGFPIIAAVGADTNIGIFIDAKGTGNIRLRTNGGLIEQFRVSHVANAVNFLSASGATANNPARLEALGSDANIDIAIAPKGTGVPRLLGVRDYADDAAAAAGGIAINGIYRTGSILKIRVA